MNINDLGRIGFADRVLSPSATEPVPVSAHPGNAPLRVCSNRPRPSVQNNHSKGHQWWARDVWHIRGDGARTLCGVDCADWLTIGPLEEIDSDCCRRCAKARGDA